MPEAENYTCVVWLRWGMIQLPSVGVGHARWPARRGSTLALKTSALVAPWCCQIRSLIYGKVGKDHPFADSCNTSV